MGLVIVLCGRLSIPRLTSKEDMRWLYTTASNFNYRPVLLRINSMIDQIEYAVLWQCKLTAHTNAAAVNDRQHHPHVTTPIATTTTTTSTTPYNITTTTTSRDVSNTIHVHGSKRGRVCVVEVMDDIDGVT